jgi:hypothetical protein
VAPPGVIAELKGSLSKPAASIVVKELHKDLTRVPDHELTSHLRSNNHQQKQSLVLPGLVPGIYVFAVARKRGWPGQAPAMIDGTDAYSSAELLRSRL